VNLDFHFASRLRQNTIHFRRVPLSLWINVDTRIQCYSTAPTASAEFMRGSEAGCRYLTIPERSVFILDSSKRGTAFAF
jgi:hypothetical protein